MLSIRSFILDGVALTGVAAGVMAGVGGYLTNLPGTPEHVAVVAAAAYGWPDPETTGAITPKDASAAADRHDGAPADDATSTRSRPAGEVRIWTDPPRRSVRPRGE